MTSYYLYDKSRPVKKPWWCEITTLNFFSTQSCQISLICTDSSLEKSCILSMCYIINKINVKFLLTLEPWRCEIPTLLFVSTQSCQISLICTDSSLNIVVHFLFSNEQNQCGIFTDRGNL